MSSSRTGAEYLAKVKSNVFNWRSWFVYDKRTRSIRVASKPAFALATTKGKGTEQGNNVVFRAYAKHAYRETYALFRNKQIINVSLMCLTPSNFRTDENNTVVWWKCNGNAAQKWQRGVKVPKEKLTEGEASKSF
jgi:hypothetical protein